MSRSAVGRVAALEAAKEDAGRRAGALLPGRVGRDVLAYLDAQAAGGLLWTDICRAAAALEDLARSGGGGQLEDPAGPTARAWDAALWNTPPGQRWPPCPDGAAAYFEREARVCEDAARALLEDGPSPTAALEDSRRALRWGGASWAWRAALARAGQ